MQLWQQCHTAGFSGAQRLCWPDGKSLLEQPAIVVTLFSLITEEVHKASKSGG